MEGARLTLVASFANQWPPGGSTRGGYHPHPALSGHLVDLLPLDLTNGRGALCIAEDDNGDFWCVGVMLEQWRLATAGDGLAQSLAAAAARGDWTIGSFRGCAVQPLPLSDPASQEHAITADQTHLSIVSGNFIVKILQQPDARGHHLQRLEHLRALGFTAMPHHYAHIEWNAPGGWCAIAFIDEYLPGSVDGWEWCVDAAKDFVRSELQLATASPHSVGSSLGGLMAQLHVAAASPSSVLSEPTRVATPAEILGWCEHVREQCLRAQAAFPELTSDQRLARGWHALTARISTPLSTRPRYVMPTHGDLHIGQVLWTSDGSLVLIDFEGDPLDGTRPLLDSPLKDVAHLLTSLAMVEQVVGKDGGASARLRFWVRTACASMLAAYRAGMQQHSIDHMFDPGLLDLFVAEQVAAELIYAHGVLPRWAYAPLGLVGAASESSVLSSAGYRNGAT